MIGISIAACHSGARIGANPESRADNLWIPGSLASLAPRNDRTHKREAAATRSRVAAAPDFQALILGVTDAIDGAGPVVGNEHRTVLGQNDIGRPAEIALVA